MSVAGERGLQNRPVSIMNIEEGGNVFENIDAALATKASATAVTKKCDLTVIAPDYDATSTYTEGEFVTHGGKLYYALGDIETAEAWTAAHWQETTIVELITALS